MTPEDIEAYVDAAAALMGLPIAPEHRPGVLHYFALAASMALNVFAVVQLIVLAWGMNLRIPPVALFVIVPVVVCLAALPITPSGLGTREFLFVLMLTHATLGVDDTSALSLSLLAYAGSFIWSLLGGVVYMMFKERHQLKEHDLDAKNDP